MIILVYRIDTINEVANIDEDRLMGLKKHSDYPEQKYLYVMHTYRVNNSIFNRVVRYYGK